MTSKQDKYGMRFRIPQYDWLDKPRFVKTYPMTRMLLQQVPTLLFYSVHTFCKNARILSQSYINTLSVYTHARTLKSPS